MVELQAFILKYGVFYKQLCDEKNNLVALRPQLATVQDLLNAAQVQLGVSQSEQQVIEGMLDSTRRDLAVKSIFFYFFLCFFIYIDFTTLPIRAPGSR